MHACEHLQPQKALSVFVSFMFPSDPVSQMWKLRLCKAFRASGSVSDAAGISAWGCRSHCLRSTWERRRRGWAEWGGKLRNLNQNEDREGGLNDAHFQAPGGHHRQLHFTVTFHTVCMDVSFPVG